ncbi:MAG TPA: hypothetical protein VIS96_14245 [Terrimicrobiaceae bacterium]
MSDQVEEKPFDKEKATHLNEGIKEEHRRRLEWFAAVIVFSSFVVVVVGLFYFRDDQPARSWCQTIFATILGAATAYVLKGGAK